MLPANIAEGLEVCFAECREWLVNNAATMRAVLLLLPHCVANIVESLFPGYFSACSLHFHLPTMYILLRSSH